MPHNLGYHKQCNSYFCEKTTLPEAANEMKRLKDDGLFYEIQSILQSSFGNNTKSLLAGFTNNPAEQLNGYVAKYLGGKRINYSLAGSYTARVAMGVIHFNSGCHASSEYRKNKFGGVSDIPAVAKLENKRKRKSVETAATRAKKPGVRGTEIEEGVTANGGDYSEDMEPRGLEEAKNIIMEKLKRNQKRRICIEDVSKDDEHFYNEKIMNMLMSYYFYNIINSKGPKFYTKILGNTSKSYFSLSDFFVLFKNFLLLKLYIFDKKKTKNKFTCNVMYVLQIENEKWPSRPVKTTNHPLHLFNFVFSIYR